MFDDFDDFDSSTATFKPNFRDQLFSSLENMAITYMLQITITFPNNPNPFFVDYMERKKWKNNF